MSSFFAYTASTEMKGPIAYINKDLHPKKQQSGCRGAIAPRGESSLVSAVAQGCTEWSTCTFKNVYKHNHFNPEC